MFVYCSSSSRERYGPSLEVIIVHIGTRAADKRYARSIYVLPSVWSNRGAEVEVGTCDNSRLCKVDDEDVLG